MVPVAVTIDQSWPNAAYIHVPFCAHHCGYCDFAVVAGQDHLMSLYLDALGAELATLEEPRQVATIFIGGGTPSYLSASALERLLSDVTRWLPPAPGHEFTVEANPDSLDVEKIRILADHGVNRISLGAQSFHPHLLRVLERRHDPAAIARAFALVKEKIAQVSLDLIFGVPGQSLDQWRDDLDQALSLQPDHLSTYGLTYEKGTLLWKQRERGEIKPVDEDAELSFYLHAMDRLEAAGFEHYEISSFAKPGRRCRHNQVYWSNESYYGFGLGAARYVNGRRELNTRDLQTYLRKVLAGEPAVFQSEMLGPEERARETLAIQLRRAEGIDHRAFREQTGFELNSLAGKAMAEHVALGFLADDGASVRLTRKGKCVADTVIRNLI